MSLMWIARMSRPDIQFVVTFLASFSESPTEEDMQDARHVAQFLSGTINAVRVFSGPDIELSIFADASFGLHPDGKGHSGLVIAMGLDPIFNQSSKQKCIALSSTEAEIVALVESVKHLHWLEGIFEDLELPIQAPITVYQDNKSAITMLEGSIGFKRNKHMTVKTHYVKALIHDGKMILKYTPTDQMLADIHTKVLSAYDFIRLSLRFVMSSHT